MNPLEAHISVPGGKDRKFSAGSRPVKRTDPVTGITIDWGGDGTRKYVF